MKQTWILYPIALILGIGLAAISGDITGPYGLIDHHWPVVIGSQILISLWCIAHGDAEADRIRYGWQGHFLIAVIRGVLLWVVMMIVLHYTGLPWWVFIPNYMALFFLAFNLSYNYFKGHHWSYLGKESAFDVWANMIGRVRVFALAVVIYILSTIILVA